VLLSIPSFLTIVRAPSATVTAIPAAEPAGVTSSSLETYLTSQKFTLVTVNLVLVGILFLRFQVIFTVLIPLLIVYVESKIKVSPLVVVGTNVETVTSLINNLREEKSFKLPVVLVIVTVTPSSTVTSSLALTFAAQRTTSLVLEETVLFNS
jgi:hypothetical protein